MMTHHCIHILDSMPLGLIAIDLQGHIRTINKYAKSILNMTDPSMINRMNIQVLLGRWSTTPMANLFQAEPANETTHCIIKGNGKTLDVMRSPLTDDKDVILGTLITFQDITEMERTREQERINEKYAVMGELSADIAHEIRNPLGSIELLASLLRKELKREKDINRANQIMAAVRNMENKISSLIQFSNTYNIPVTYVNLHNILKDIFHHAENRVDGGWPFLSVQYADIDPVIECNPDMMKQVFLNLILNALQALPETSRLDIKTNYIEEHRNIEINFIETNTGAPENIHSDILLHLSCKQEKNWGLGLAIIHNIINMYNGSVRLEYREGVGTAFVLSFPLIDKANDPLEKRM